MKRKVIMAAAIALALVLAPASSAYVQTVSAATGSGNNTEQGGSTGNTGSGNNTEDGGSTGGGTTVTPPAAPAGEDAYTGEAVTVTNSQGTALTSSVGTVNTNTEVKSVAVTTARASVNAAAGLTAERAADGQSVQVTIANSACGPLARQAVDNAAASVNANVATILEIDLNIVGRNGAVVSEISELAAPIEFTVSTPASIANPADYDFAVVRLHDGVTEILPDLDNDPATITFTTDRFSVYAVISGAKGSFDSYKTARVKDNVPKTGETMPYAVPFAAAGIAVAAVAVILKKKEA